MIDLNSMYLLKELPPCATHGQLTCKIVFVQDFKCIGTKVDFSRWSIVVPLDFEVKMMSCHKAKVRSGILMINVPKKKSLYVILGSLLQFFKMAVDIHFGTCWDYLRDMKAINF